MSKSETRYSFGGDEFIFVELSEEMNLGMNFRVMAITKEIEKRDLPGIVTIYPANVSYMVRFDPDKMDGYKLMDELKQIEKSVTSLTDLELETRLIDIPVYFEDPWTYEALMKFRDRHQDPTITDIEYAARINACDSTEEFVERITIEPYLVTMISVMPCIPWCFQLVPEQKRIEVPKYIRPRTFTPERTFGIGGAFAVIYPIEAPGGYQIFGRSPAPIFDRDQSLPDFSQSMVLPRQGDIIKFRRISRTEYDDIRLNVQKGTFNYLIKDFSFRPMEVLENVEIFTEGVKRRLYHD